MANKQLGQHWLEDAASLNRMADVAAVSADDTVVEIGPGHGTLTRVLCRRAQCVIAIEIDDELAEQLPANVPASNLKVHQGDIRDASFNDLPPGYKVVANIPYYLTSHLVQQLLDAQPQPAVITLLMQQEVAERIAAEPGQMSVLALSVQLRATVELDAVVVAELFEPPPKVDSQIISITPTEPAVPFDFDATMRMVKIGFSNRRKTLVNNLAAGLQITKDQARQMVGQLSRDMNARPQELAPDEWIILGQLHDKA